jgi:hypothetical protein
LVACCLRIGKSFFQFLFKLSSFDIRQLSVFGYQLSVISYRLSVIGFRLSVIGYQLSIIDFQFSTY